MTATMEDINKVTTNVGDASKKIYQEPNLRYRADDEQRTLMSGQILLRGLFGPEILAADVDDETTVIKLHTGDYRKDVLVINKNICPRAAELEAEAYESEEFKQWNETSVEVQIIRKFAQSKLGLDEVPFGMLDCLMTTMCTDRPLPDPIDDYDGSLGPTPWKEDGSEGIAIVSEKDFTNIFERFVNYVSNGLLWSFVSDTASYSLEHFEPHNRLSSRRHLHTSIMMQPYQSSEWDHFGKKLWLIYFQSSEQIATTPLRKKLHQN